MTLIELIYYGAMVAVIFGHFFFAYGQYSRWPELCGKLTDLKGEEIEKTAFLGRSFASYNAAIGVGLVLSFFLEANAKFSVQAVVLALVVVTAAVGASGTKGNTILIARLAPAAIALLSIFLI